MALTHYLAWFFGGAFLTHAVPLFVSGMLGRAFQSPFAEPPGAGLSSSTVNVLWGFPNLVFSYLLMCRRLRPACTDQAIALGSGMILMGVMMARRFGRYHGGNWPVVE